MISLQPRWSSIFQSRADSICDVASQSDGLSLNFVQ